MSIPAVIVKKGELIEDCFCLSASSVKLCSAFTTKKVLEALW